LYREFMYCVRRMLIVQENVKRKLKLAVKG